MKVVSYILNGEMDSVGARYGQAQVESQELYKETYRQRWKRGRGLGRYG